MIEGFRCTRKFSYWAETPKGSTLDRCRCQCFSRRLHPSWNHRFQTCLAYRQQDNNFLASGPFFLVSLSLFECNCFLPRCLGFRGQECIEALSWSRQWPARREQEKLPFVQRSSLGRCRGTDSAEMARCSAVRKTVASLDPHGKERRGVCLHPD